MYPYYNTLSSWIYSQESSGTPSTTWSIQLNAAFMTTKYKADMKYIPMLSWPQGEHGWYFGLEICPVAQLTWLSSKSGGGLNGSTPTY